MKIINKIIYILKHPKCDGCNKRKEQRELFVDGCGTPLLMCNPCWRIKEVQKVKMEKEIRQKMIQGCIFILWKQNATEEERQEAISNFYVNNENLIESMQTFEMKKGVDIYEEWKDFEKRLQ